MGANNFENSIEADNIADAFSACVEQAAWDYGHAGYTGTIAEKDSYVEFHLKPGVDPNKAINVVFKHLDYAAYDIDDKYARADQVLPARAAIAEYFIEDPQRVAMVANDKWGPAAAFSHDGTHYFFGYASS
jgi:hypothetical protein